jgi:glycolate oxidase FAD binding subunit
MTVASSSPSWPELVARLDPEGLRPAVPGDGVDGVVPTRVAEPRTAGELAECLSWARAAGLKVTPRGGGTKLGWGNPPRACDLVVSTKRLDEVLDHAWADLTVVVQAGCRVATLQKTLAEHSQHLALDPLWPEGATIGGILSTNDSGPLRFRYGSLRDLVIGVTVALPDGTIAKGGGKVVKNVAGYDLPKLYTGALGTLGVIVEAVFRVHPLPRVTRSLSFAGSTADLHRTLMDVLDSPLTPHAVQLRVSETESHLDVRFSGTAAGVEYQVDRAVRWAEGSVTMTEAPESIWTFHEAIWKGAASALVLKVSVLPSALASLCDQVRRWTRERSLGWHAVLQATGAGYLRLEGDEESLRAVLVTAQSELCLKEGALVRGTVVALSCPLPVKQGLDVWGPPDDGQFLMERIKERFDPDRVLNPGRFVGGI